MLYHKKKRIWSLLFTFFCSLLLHLALFLSYKVFPVGKSSLLSDTQEDLILVEYPVHRQIVSQEEFNNISPKKQSYLSQKDKTVEKETQAMLSGLFHQADQSLGVKKKDFLKPIERKTSSETQDLLVDKISEPVSMELSALDSDINSEIVFREKDKQRLSRTMDFLPGVEFGSNTLLNTREFVYYSYFSRMKEQLYWSWTQYIKKELLQKRFSLNSLVNKYKSRHFATSIYVYLSPEGELQDMRVVKSSGVEDIDSAALHAFLLAEPFPNPPKGLIEEDGYIHVKQIFNLSIVSFLSQNLFSRQE